MQGGQHVVEHRHLCRREDFLQRLSIVLPRRQPGVAIRLPGIVTPLTQCVAEGRAGIPKVGALSVIESPTGHQGLQHFLMLAHEPFLAFGVWWRQQGQYAQLFATEHRVQTLAKGVAQAACK